MPPKLEVFAHFCENSPNLNFRILNFRPLSRNWSDFGELLTSLSAKLLFLVSVDHATQLTKMVEGMQSYGDINLRLMLSVVFKQNATSSHYIRPLFPIRAVSTNSISNVHEATTAPAQLGAPIDAVTLSRSWSLSPRTQHLSFHPQAQGMASPKTVFAHPFPYYSNY